jgi:uncharacterized LabA/DUF88 family protein
MRAPVSPVHRGPQAVAAIAPSPFQHAPNAALLIDFDNVTMGIRSDLAGELRNLLGSEIIKGKVAVQRAYADWRRYPQYIVPLAESSIDMIMAPAYGTSKKNATDIRLSVDAMELVFTRPEIGTYILLSGDSDFASLVTKLKEYGKYVIGVGIRESSSDLLVMNCDEYYSYSALAGLVKSSDEEVVKWDPWELVTEAINRMVKNGDVMRSDRLKQVMQDIDPGFDEKNLGMSKFSKFCQEAATRGLIKVTKLENGQLEVAPSDDARRVLPQGQGAPSPRLSREAGKGDDASEREERSGRRGRRGRGRGRDREDRGTATPQGVPSLAAPQATATPSVTPTAMPTTTAAPSAVESQPTATRAPAAPPVAHVSQPAGVQVDIGRSGERLTQDEAFDLLKKAATTLVPRDGSVPAKALRQRAFELLGRDSESLNERYFSRILRDAHDAEIIDLRRRGDDYEVSLPTEVAPVSDQLNRAAAAHAAAHAAAVPAAPPAPRGMGHRGVSSTRGRSGARLAAPPADLLTIGVVEEERPRVPEAPAAATAAATEPATERPKGRPRAGRTKVAAKGKAASAAAPGSGEPKDAGPPPKKKTRSRPRSKKGEAAA